MNAELQQHIEQLFVSLNQAHGLVKNASLLLEDIELHFIEIRKLVPQK